MSAVTAKKNDQVHFNKMGKAMEETKLSLVKELMSTFQSTLAEFAAKHKDRINSDPEFRQQFQKMCISVGVDPLASSKGFWADILGVGDFYFELGVKVIELTVQTRAINGGVMTVMEVVRLLNANRISKAYTNSGKSIHLSGSSSSISQELVEDDVLRAIDKIKVLGNGFRLVKVGKQNIVISVPLEVNVDHEIIMNIAQLEGYVTKQAMLNMNGWTEERFNYVMNPLLQEGMVWIDRYNGMYSLI